MTTILNRNDPAAYAAAADLLRDGEVVALPTDTVYGLAADATNPAAVSQLFQLKDRPVDHSIAVLVASLDAALQLVRLPPAAQRLASKFWPGPMTLVAERRSTTPAHLGNNHTGTLGVRLADDDLIQHLAATAPLAATSANLHQGPTPTEAQAVAQLFPSLPLVIDGGLCPSRASTVVDITGPLPVVLREGPIPAGTVVAVASEPTLHPPPSTESFTNDLPTPGPSQLH